MERLQTMVRVTEIDATSDAIVRIYDSDAKVQSDNTLKSIMDNMRDLSSRITAAINSERVYSSLDDKDVARNVAIRKFALLAEGYTAFPDEQKSVAANAVFSVFVRHGRNFSQKSQKEKSSLIASLLDDLDDQETSQKIASLDGLPVLIERIREAQNDFLAAYDDFMKAKMEFKKKESASAIKKLLLECINDRLLPFVQVMERSSDDKFENFSAAVKHEISSANAEIKARKSLAKKRTTADNETVGENAKVTV